MRDTFAVRNMNEIPVCVQSSELSNCHEPPKTWATPGSSALLLVYQSSHPGMTEMGEKTALPQSRTNDRVGNKICYVYMNLFTK